MHRQSKRETGRVCKRNLVCSNRHTRLTSKTIQTSIIIILVVAVIITINIIIFNNSYNYYTVIQQQLHSHHKQGFFVTVTVYRTAYRHLSSQVKRKKLFVMYIANE